MFELILVVAVVGLVAWAIVTYVPMPQPFQGLVIILALLIVLVMIFGGGGGLNLGLHKFC